MLAIDADILRQHPAVPDDVRDRAHGMHKQLVELCEGAHDLARRLHPSIVDDLGIVDALRAECLNSARRDRCIVQFFGRSSSTRHFERDQPLHLPRGARALRNIARHAKARRALVRLRATDRGLVLVIRDRGIGFDTTVSGKRGMGLESMRSAPRLVGARLAVKSRPGEGTMVSLHVPLVESRQ